MSETKEEIGGMLKAILQAQIVQALNSTPEAIEKLVKAALSQPVDKGTGDSKGYGDKVPYLDWLVGAEIRNAARGAVNKTIGEAMPLIEAEVRKGLSAEQIVQAFAKSIVHTASQDWRIDVKFESEDKRR